MAWDVYVGAQHFGAMVTRVGEELVRKVSWDNTLDRFQEVVYLTIGKFWCYCFYLLGSLLEKHEYVCYVHLSKMSKESDFRVWLKWASDPEIKRKWFSRFTSSLFEPCLDLLQSHLWRQLVRRARRKSPPRGLTTSCRWPPRMWWLRGTRWPLPCCVVRTTTLLPLLLPLTLQLCWSQPPTVLSRRRAKQLVLVWGSLVLWWKL